MVMTGLPRRGRTLMMLFSVLKHSGTSEEERSTFDQEVLYQIECGLKAAQCFNLAIFFYDF